MQLLKSGVNCRLNGISGQINLLIDREKGGREINTIYLTGKGKGKGKSKGKGLSHNRPSRWPKGVRVG